MSNKREPEPDAPDHLDVGAGAERRSIPRVPDLYAAHAIRSGAPVERAVLTLDDGEIAVFRKSAEPGDAPHASLIGPVYQLHPGGSLGVPTGLVFIRFADAERVESRRGDLTRAGYDVERILAYAPNAAWLKRRTGSIGDALRGIDSLRAMAGVEHVEAELKTTRSARG